MLVFASGCAGMKKRGTGSGLHNSSSVAPAAPAAPPGTRLGNPYYSALGEHCYELLPDTYQPARVGAICQRGGAWEVLPEIHMTLASTVPPPAR